MSLNQSKMSSLSDKIEATKEITKVETVADQTETVLPEETTVSDLETVAPKKVVKVKRRLNK